MTTVMRNLVCNRDFATRYLTDSQIERAVTAVFSASFPVDIRKINTSLGRFLAENILTTRADDDLSSLVLVMPYTENDFMMKTVINEIEKGFGRSLGEQIASAETSLNSLKARLKMLGDDPSLFNYRSFRYEWPVLGSGKIKRLVSSTEEYFDFCGKYIRQKGFVIHTAGNVEFPMGLAKTMINGRGGQILEAFRAKKALKVESLANA